ncbi:hypothetical protein [Aliiroseovarius subalbicans]|uniref:hypothetical protein n=1 Tax=Aliiroseovarius subalbicans TaxID=2925840 RepID=UPI001F58F82B|nr:hypothetical protein [Aliiroseovarius subalbicans]MCI2398156.1 hypothetical protein [Aliiroseovarius subalbicans]
MRIEDLKNRYRQAMTWVRMNVPPGLRLVLGLIVMVLGFFGFLPVIGFWMIPLGIAIMALDIRPLWRWFKAR